MVFSSIDDVNALISNEYREEDVYGSTEIQLDCLLPTGIYIALAVDRWSTVTHVKETLWKEAANYPLFSTLSDATCYTFVYINSFGEREEIRDEEKQISTIQPFLSVLKVIRREERNVEKDLNSQIGALIGKHDFESMRDEEVIAFRRESKQLCERLNEEKGTVRDLDKLISFVNPPDVCEDVELWQRVTEALATEGQKFVIEIPHTQSNGNAGTHRLLVKAEQYPEDVINGALQKQSQASIRRVNYELDDYVLKIVGREEYLLPDADNKPRPLYKYTYIYKCIMKQESPKLAVLKKSDVVKPVPRPRKASSAIPVPPRPAKALKSLPNADLWQIPDKFALKVVQANNLNCGKDSTVYLRAAIYHGVETVCDVQDTPEVPVSENSAEFNHRLVFDLAVCDLPRMSRLCIALYSGTQKPNKNPRKATTVKATGKTLKKRLKSVDGAEQMPSKKASAPLAWVNMCLFDFKARLAVGRATRHLWPCDQAMMSSDNPTNHLGTVVNNPHTGSAIALVLKFSYYGQKNRPIAYPPFDKVLECAAREMSNDSEYGTIGKSDMTEEEAKIQLSELLDNRDPLQSFHEQEKEHIWAMRLDMSTKHRESLPKLLSCVRWNNHTQVAQMQAQLQAWPDISVDTALELLDCMYPDKNVRHFAISCLRNSISDTELCRYLLQLVQALKFESYLGCDLVYFLLERAIRNRKLGHYLFWLLKSEMHVPSVSVRFGLIIEAYCKGSVDHVSILRDQDDTVSKLLAINRLVKSLGDVPKQKGLESMRDILLSYKQSDAFGEGSSPLDPALRLASLRVEKCKYMDSKMKPLWLVWENGDRYGDDIKIIFKNGDDLRQDMLTLQILHIMDNIWTSQGLDLRLNPYDCLSTGRDIGMLQVVQNANTIANIQKENAAALTAALFNKECLYKWLQEKNPDPALLQKAISEFTRSCAGYCVASYVLGIGDRHSDNIMLKETGQLFHIDFGHFLGNFKSKMGIKRERVPFVFANDFIYVIERDTTVARPFSRFKELCEKAYLLLRKKGPLLISLFMMMLSTGLPELRTVSDLKYLQDTLQLDLSDDKALKHFRRKFNEAINGSWKTSVNWTFHNVAKDNV